MGYLTSRYLNIPAQQRVFGISEAFGTLCRPYHQKYRNVSYRPLQCGLLIIVRLTRLSKKKNHISFDKNRFRGDRTRVRTLPLPLSPFLPLLPTPPRPPSAACCRQSSCVLPITSLFLSENTCWRPLRAFFLFFTPAMCYFAVLTSCS